MTGSGSASRAAVSGSGGGGGGGASSSSSTSTACAACKYQRRKCTPDCPLSPYFPPDQPKRFQNVHKLFGVSNILRILKHVDPSKREDTVKSISYEADTREKDPVHGCLGVITILQNQVSKLKEELAVARDQLYLLQQQQQQQQQQHSFHQQTQMQQIVSSLGGSTGIVNVSSAGQETNVLLHNFQQSYNDMSSSNPLPLGSSFEPDQYLRNDGFDHIKPGTSGAASSSRFDVGRYMSGESSGHHQASALLMAGAAGDHNRHLPVDPFATAIRRRGSSSSGLPNLTVSSDADLRRAAGGDQHGVPEHELRSAGVYLTLTNN